MKKLGTLIQLLALATIAPQQALADPPPASFVIDFAGDAAIWNPFEGFLACEEIDTPEFSQELCLELHDVVCDGKGACGGTSEFTFAGDLFNGSTTGPATTKTKCKAGSDPVCRAGLGFETEGAITVSIPDIGDLTCDTAIRGRVKGPVDAGGSFDGFGSGSVCLECVIPGERPLRDCEPFRGAFPYDVNPPTPWSLTVEVSLNGKKLEGTATDSLGFSYTAKGRYDERKDESSISLAGDKGTESQGAKVSLKKLVTEGSEVTGGSAKLSVQGNTSTVELGP